MDNLFKFKLINCDQNSLSDIGFDKSYLFKAVNKHKFLSIKICGLNCAQANILKQTAIACGTDCAVHREVITGKVDLSDCILSGSLSELSNICSKLKHQPFRLNTLSEQIESFLSTKKSTLIIRNKTFDFNSNVYLMGILNVTPDSFSDGGKFNNIETAIAHYNEMIAQGADIVDIGGESTRPYSQPTGIDEEIERVIPIIKKIRSFDTKTVLSIDTRNAKTAKLALDAGVDIINDISALEHDKDMLDVLKNYNCPIVLNHTSAPPILMQDNTDYNDLIDDIYDYFYNKIVQLKQNGIFEQQIIIDPGIGFGKTKEQNFEIIKRLKEFKTLGCPILVGHSRKKFIQQTMNTTDNNKLDEITAVLSAELINNGANILRVHNIQINKEIITIKNLLS